jgi:hypothetical protein
MIIVNILVPTNDKSKIFEFARTPLTFDRSEALTKKFMCIMSVLFVHNDLNRTP